MTKISFKVFERKYLQPLQGEAAIASPIWQPPGVRAQLCVGIYEAGCVGKAVNTKNGR
jgi:hypothetical protein